VPLNPPIPSDRDAASLPEQALLANTDKKL
jgi:hypothetical protein